jgi:hypothetical protein
MSGRSKSGMSGIIAVCCTLGVGVAAVRNMAKMSRSIGDVEPTGLGRYEVGRVRAARDVPACSARSASSSLDSGSRGKATGCGSSDRPRFALCRSAEGASAISMVGYDKRRARARARARVGRARSYVRTRYAIHYISIYRHITQGELDVMRRETRCWNRDDRNVVSGEGKRKITRVSVSPRQSDDVSDGKGDVRGWILEVDVSREGDSPTRNLRSDA